MQYYPTVVQVVAGSGRNIIVYFSDGKITKSNMEPLINEGGVFKEIADRNSFSDKLTVLNETAAWDISGDRDPFKCIDIDPETLYNSEKIQDPLEEKDPKR